MIRIRTLTLPSAALLLLMTAPKAPAHPPPQVAGGTAQPAAESNPEDRNLENTLARTFESLRAAQHLRPLARIPDHPALRQLTCTAAQTGTPLFRDLSLEANGPSALFQSKHLAHLPPEFLDIAAYNDHGADPSHKITRYSISAWPSARAPGTVWIGVALYWSHLRQVFAVRVTHIYRNPDILGDLAPACLNIR